MQMEIASYTVRVYSLNIFLRYAPNFSVISFCCFFFNN